ncbi:hypothetical protein M3O57_19515, partial [Xanthomonas nasturtii]|nr:hypothetical protein [Xanthomonas nasturtii]MCL1592538.1 hypothetical protein [Xanthomonas nasturtii]
MTALPSSALNDYIASPFGLLHLEGIHVGRFRIDRAIIRGREAAINLQECILAALDETGRKSGLKNSDVPPILSSAAVWSPIPYPKEIGRE